MNQLKVHTQQSILTLAEPGWSKRRIARELGLDRATVRKYLAEAPKSPTPQTGSADDAEAKSPTPPQTGSSGVPQPASVCDPWAQQIEAAWQAGRMVQRIYQDLVVEHQFTGSYHAVRRFVRRRLGAVPDWRLAFHPPAPTIQPMFFRATAIWFLLLVLAILNGGARVSWITPRWGEQTGHWVSTAIFCSILLVVAWASIGWVHPSTTGRAIQVGLLWLTLTMAFEFLGGHYLFGNPWEKLLADYNLLRGRVWVLVLLTTALAPILMFRLRHPGS